MMTTKRWSGLNKKRKSSIMTRQKTPKQQQTKSLSRQNSTWKNRSTQKNTNKRARIRLPEDSSTRRNRMKKSQKKMLQRTTSSGQPRTAWRLAMNSTKI